MGELSYTELVNNLRELHEAILLIKEELHKKSLVVELQQRQIDALLSTLWLIKAKLPSADQHVVEQLLASAKATVVKG